MCEKWSLAAGLGFFQKVGSNCAQLNTVIYKAAINACEKGWHCQQVLQFFERLRGKHLWGVSITYKAAISACAKGGQWQQDLDLFKRVGSNRVQRNIIIYKAGINACNATISVWEAVCIASSRCSTWTWAPPPAETDGEAANPGPRQRKGGPRSLEAQHRRSLRHTNFDKDVLWSDSSFLVWHLNVQGLFSHVAELTARVQQAAVSPALICLNETFLDGEVIELPGYR